MTKLYNRKMEVHRFVLPFFYGLPRHFLLGYLKKVKNIGLIAQGLLSVKLNIDPSPTVEFTLMVC